MSCLDEISNVIGDGMYLSMADKLKSIHNKLNGDRPFHEDSFYYSDEEETSNSDDDSDYSYPANGSPDGAVLQRNREISIDRIRAELLEYVKCMHVEWRNVENWTKVVESITPIKRMTAARKQQAIRRWCERSRGWRRGGSAGDLIGCGPIVTGSIFWSWKNLLENGLHAIVMEIGTEEEIEKAKRKNMHCDDLSLATLKKLPAFEKKIYDDYKREYNEEVVENRREANAKVREHEEFMQRWEMRAREEENKNLVPVSMIVIDGTRNPMIFGWMTSMDYW